MVTIEDGGVVYGVDFDNGGCAIIVFRKSCIPCRDLITHTHTIPPNILVHRMELHDALPIFRSNGLISIVRP